jgi:hypothetical protein
MSRRKAHSWFYLPQCSVTLHLLNVVEIEGAELEEFRDILPEQSPDPVRTQSQSRSTVWFPKLDLRPPQALITTEFNFR